MKIYSWGRNNSSFYNETKTDSYTERETPSNKIKALDGISF